MQHRTRPDSWARFVFPDQIQRGITTFKRLALQRFPEILIAFHYSFRNSMTRVDDVYKLLHRLFSFEILEMLLMPVIVEMHNTGNAELQRDVVAMIEHVLSDRPGEWRVSILGSQASDQWEMKIFGPNAFERSYMLEGGAGLHEPKAIASIVSKMVPS